MKFETESLREAIFVKRGLDHVLEREHKQLEYILNNRQTVIENGMDPDECEESVKKNIEEIEDLLATATAKMIMLTEQKYACFGGH